VAALAAEDLGWLAGKVAKKVRVHTKDEVSYDGLLCHVAIDGIVLVGARDVDKDVPIAGEIFIPRDNVHMIQVLAVPWANLS
jgi:hypothetical protein